MTESKQLLEAARTAADVARAHRVEIERGGRTPPAVVDAFINAGLFRMWLPKALGGLEVDPLSFIQVIEEVSAADGAAGWNLMNGAAYAMMAGFFPEHVARQIWSTPRDIAAGQLPPLGKARAVEGGYAVTGRWRFGSGILHSTWAVSGCTICDESDQPLLTAAGQPQRTFVLTPISDVAIDEDSWHVSGLRGTGSCDYTLTDVFVPQERAFQFLLGKSYQPGPLYHLPPTIFAVPVTSVCIGIARSAVDALVTLVETGSRGSGGPALRDRPSMNFAAARAAGLVDAGHALLCQRVSEVWATACAGEPITLDQRRKLRTAVALSAEMSAQAVDLVWKAAGATSIRESSVIERCFRDVHAATQHLTISEDVLYDAGRVMFGLEPASPMF
jgi:alkylation response protein AidB-like acyl-CoA dehydrogenase